MNDVNNEILSAEPNDRGYGNPIFLFFLALLLIITIGVFTYSAGHVFTAWSLVILSGLSMIGATLIFGYVTGIIHFNKSSSENSIYLNIINNDKAPSVITDSKGQITFANSAYKTMAEISKKSHKSTVEALYAGFPDISDNIYRLAKASSNKIYAKEEIRLEAGSSAPGSRRDKSVWLKLEVIPINDENLSGYTFWRISDTTDDREEQEVAFRQLQAIIDYLDHAPAGFFSAVADGQIKYINATLAELLGLDLAQTTGGALQLSDLIITDDLHLINEIEPIPGGDHIEEIELNLKNNNNQPIPASIIHKVSFDTEGNKSASRSLVIDKKTDKNVQDTINVDEKRIMQFLDNAPIGIATIDNNNLLLRTNNAFTSILGEKGKIGNNLLELVTEESRTVLESSISTVRDGHKKQISLDVGFAENAVSSSGRIYISNINNTPNDKNLVVYAIDTTEHKELELQFAQSQKMQAIGQLAGGVAHDFNNVLTAIIGFADLLLVRHRPTDPSFQDIMNIKQNANRAANLVRQLLAFSRRQTLRPAILLLTDALSDLGNLLGRLLGEKIELKVIHDRELWKIKADINQFEQVIINLAVNARDAMPEGGALTVRTRNIDIEESKTIDPKIMEPGEYVLCEIEDNGTGMPPEVLQKIYDPFFSTKEVGKGTGLGLSTVYGIIKQTGGFIFADSEEGKGTTFRIYLPRYEETEEDKLIDEPEKEIKRKDLTGHGTILLVEDEDAVRAFASRALESRGYTVLKADSGETALELIDENHEQVDLVISDVVMPEMDGPTLLKELRARDYNGKFIFISGYAEEAFKKNLGENETFAFLPKPFSLKQLAAAVKENLT